MLDALLQFIPIVWGGVFFYKCIPIFNSLGDFLMDGSSFRRREAGILELNIENSQLKEWSFTPTVTNMNLQVTFPTGKKSKKDDKCFLFESVKS